MTHTTQEFMTPDPIVLDAIAPVNHAAQAMRDADIGDVMVHKDGHVCGVVTDRDIVVRLIADGGDAKKTTLGEICSREVTTVTADTPVRAAVDVMRAKAIRRLPVVDGGRPVGIVSIGDLAVALDERSALSDISAAPSNQ